MNNDKGFFKVPRGCMFQQVFSNPDVFYVYVVLLYLARYKAEEIDGVTVREGQVLITVNRLAEITGLGVREIRYILDRFQDFGCITKENVKFRYTLITVLPVFTEGKPLVRASAVKETVEEKKNVYQKFSEGEEELINMCKKRPTPEAVNCAEADAANKTDNEADNGAENYAESAAAYEEGNIAEPVEENAAEPEKENSCVCRETFSERHYFSQDSITDAYPWGVSSDTLNEIFGGAYNDR